MTMHDTPESTSQITEAIELVLPERIPPTALDTDALIQAGRRARRRRTAIGAGLTVAVAAGVAVTLVAGSQLVVRHHGSPVAPNEHPSSSPSPSPRQETQAEAMNRLTLALQAIVQRDLPGTRLHGNDWTGDQHTTVPALTFQPHQRFAVVAAADTHDAQGSGAIEVELSTDPTFASGHGCATGGWPFAGNRTTCVTRRAGGTNVTIATTTTATGAVEYYVYATRADGTAAAVQDQPYAEGDIDHGKTMTAPQAERATPPLTIDQAVEIVVDPALHYDSVRPGG